MKQEQMNKESELGETRSAYTTAFIIIVVAIGVFIGLIIGATI